MRAKSIFRATKQHALNLAKFVSIYKTLLLVQRKSNGGKERSADTFIAGLIGGYLVFGERTAVNEQVCSPSHTVACCTLKCYSTEDRSLCDIPSHCVVHTSRELSVLNVAHRIADGWSEAAAP
jgi:hypothetical protein